MFEPKGDLPEWRLIYDHAKGLGVGDTVTYETLDALLGRDFTTSRSPIYRATTELENEDSRTLACVPNIGYRIVPAAEHEGLARHHHKKSRNSIGRAVDKIRAADRSQLSAEERRHFNDMQVHFARLAEMVQRVDAKVTDIATALSATPQTAPELHVVRGGETEEKTQTA